MSARAQKGDESLAASLAHFESLSQDEMRFLSPITLPPASLPLSLAFPALVSPSYSPCHSVTGSSRRLGPRRLRSREREGERGRKGGRGRWPRVQAVLHMNRRRRRRCPPLLSSPSAPVPSSLASSVSPSFLSIVPSTLICRIPAAAAAAAPAS